jgi:DNA gyrase/topoisomerase IV subunit A
VKIIRSSDDASEAKESLIKSFKLTDEQATYILDMPLRRLTKMSKIELESEQKELKSTIAKLTALLKSDEALRKQVSDELSEVATKYATPRRTLIA